jgi:3-dehydroquinate synthase
MSSVEVKAEKIYQVHLDQEWLPLLQQLVQKRNKVAIISSQSTDSIIPSFDLPDSTLYHYPIPDGEAGKSAAVATGLWEKLHQDGFTRTDLIVGIGGGAVTDLAGFVAASWLRGIDWIAVPTTLAGMVDAAIGGKTGINTSKGKNLVGAFHSPSAVIIDTQWLRSLSRRDFAAGLAEVIKCGFIRDSEILHLLKDRDLDSVIADQALTRNLISRAVAVKANVVSKDFRESDLREILNYGHTFGHAIESSSGYSLRHGEAVSIGMVFIAELAHLAGLISVDFVNQHRSILSSMELPASLSTDFTPAHWPTLLTSMRSDKKARGDVIRFVVVSEPGSVSRLEEPDETLLKLAYEKVLP